MIYNKRDLYIKQKQLYGINKHLLFPLAGVLINVLLLATIMSIKFEFSLKGFAAIPLPDLILTGILTISFLYISDFVINTFDLRFRIKPNSVIRYILEILCVLLLGMVMIQAMVALYLNFTVDPADRNADFMASVTRSKIILINFLLVMYAFLRGFHFFAFLKRKEIEVIKWQKDISQSTFEALKNQLNPHFLFNSFSILISLIHKDASLADEFIGKLSKAYRYLLDQRDKETIPLFTELEFLKNFEFILSHRFQNKISIRYPNSVSNNSSVIPYTIILIIEHLIATHRMSRQKPLLIDLTIEKERLNITHSYSPKTNQKVNEQLLILQERYEQISGKKIVISKTGDRQFISIPLLPTS